MPFIDVGVGDKEAVGVPERNQQVAQGVLHALFGEAQAFAFDDRRVDHVQP